MTNRPRSLHIRREAAPCPPLTSTPPSSGASTPRSEPCASIRWATSSTPSPGPRRHGVGKSSTPRLYQPPVGGYLRLVRHIELFLSTVSDEFRSYRDSLRDKLKRPNVDIHVQEDFIATGTETLDKLNRIIVRCDAVIHIAGDMT